MAKKSVAKNSVKGVVKDFTENTKFNATIRFNKNAVLTLTLDTNAETVDLILTDSLNGTWKGKTFLAKEHIFD